MKAKGFTRAEVLEAGLLPSELGRSSFADKIEVRKCEKCGTVDEIPVGETVCDSCDRAINSGWEF